MKSFEEYNNEEISRLHHLMTQLPYTIENFRLLGRRIIIGFNVNETLHIQSIKIGNRTSYRWSSSRGVYGNWTSMNNAMKFGTRYAKTNGFVIEKK